MKFYTFQDAPKRVTVTHLSDRGERRETAHTLTAASFGRYMRLVNSGQYHILLSESPLAALEVEMWRKFVRFPRNARA